MRSRIALLAVVVRETIGQWNIPRRHASTRDPMRRITRGTRRKRKLQALLGTCGTCEFQGIRTVERRIILSSLGSRSSSTVFTSLSNRGYVYVPPPPPLNARSLHDTRSIVITNSSNYIFLIRRSGLRFNGASVELCRVSFHA